MEIRERHHTLRREATNLTREIVNRDRHSLLRLIQAILHRPELRQYIRHIPAFKIETPAVERGGALTALHSTCGLAQLAYTSHLLDGRYIGDFVEDVRRTIDFERLAIGVYTSLIEPARFRREERNRFLNFDSDGDRGGNVIVDMLFLLPKLETLSLSLQRFRYLSEVVKLSTVDWEGGRKARGAYNTLKQLTLVHISPGHYDDYELLFPILALPDLQRLEVHGVSQLTQRAVTDGYARGLTKAPLRHFELRVRGLIAPGLHELLARIDAAKLNYFKLMYHAPLRNAVYEKSITDVVRKVAPELARRVAPQRVGMDEGSGSLVVSTAYHAMEFVRR